MSGPLHPTRAPNALDDAYFTGRASTRDDIAAAEFLASAGARQFTG